MKHRWFYASETLLDALFIFFLPYAQELSNFRICGYYLFYVLFRGWPQCSQCYSSNIKVRPNKSVNKKVEREKKNFRIVACNIWWTQKSEWQPKHSHHVANVRNVSVSHSCDCLHIVRSRKSQKVYCPTTKTFATSFCSDCSSSRFFSVMAHKCVTMIVIAWHGIPIICCWLDLTWLG